MKRGPEAESAQEKQWYQAIVDQTVDSSFVKRYGTLDEQAAPIVFLAGAAVFVDDAHASGVLGNGSTVRSSALPPTAPCP